MACATLALAYTSRGVECATLGCLLQMSLSLAILCQSQYVVLTTLVVIGFSSLSRPRTSSIDRDKIGVLRHVKIVKRASQLRSILKG